MILQFTPRHAGAGLAFLILVMAGSLHGAEPVPLALDLVGAAAEPNVTAAADGGFVVTFQERKWGTIRAMQIDLDAAGATPRVGHALPAERKLFANWADFPAAIELAGGSLVGYTLQRSGPGTYAYDVVLARRPPPPHHSWESHGPVHDDGTQTEHGFVSLLRWSDDRALVAWLDGRQTAGKAEGEAPMTLRAALVDRALKKHGEWALDAMTCDCCQTDAARTASGAVVVYRDRTPGEVRDIAIVRFDGERWSAPALVHADGWHMPACPVNGPQVAAHGDTVLVAWYTGAGAQPSVRIARSTDGGASFAPPVVVDGNAPLGRVDVAYAPDGDALVTWLAVDGRTTRLELVRLDAELAPRERHTLATLEPGRSTGFPRLAVSGDNAVVVWTRPGKDDSRIAGVRIPL